jgi:hypothetical protein
LVLYLLQAIITAVAFSDELIAVCRSICESQIDPRDVEVLITGLSSTFGVHICNKATCIPFKPKRLFTQLLQSLIDRESTDEVDKVRYLASVAIGLDGDTNTVMVTWIWLDFHTRVIVDMFSAMFNRLYSSGTYSMDNSEDMRVLLEFWTGYLRRIKLAVKKKEETIGKFHRIFRFPWRTDVITDDGRMQKAINKFTKRKRKLDNSTLEEPNTKKQRKHHTPGL